MDLVACDTVLSFLVELLFLIYAVLATCSHGAGGCALGHISHSRNL